MDLKDFEIGLTYRIKITDWEAPDGGTVPGKTIVRRVLEPANQANSKFEDGPAPRHVIAEWSQFLRVQNPDSGQVHLLHPRTIESALTIQ
ncbi:hypothetical protein EZI54_06960 [Marinobacter halodurans]|uniref:Uncharacterized protein n=1 Tax=Marinobacter halodurans TaxID=2528979 RepID=A0ABY1ZP63_9GAMM|nr:hypothetical protein [Marinobacter halodurans]TBW57390.1 hypothetical protein EZI54_06960 [Marinobacter halodurans]